MRRKNKKVAMTFLVGLAIGSRRPTPPKRRFEKPGKSTSMDRAVGKVANSLPKAEFFRISRKLSKDAGVSAGATDLSATTQVVDTPIQRKLQENLEQRPQIRSRKSNGTAMTSHCFGASGDPKLIVSLSLVAGALFRWKNSSVLFALCRGRLDAFPWLPFGHGGVGIPDWRVNG